MCSVESNLNLGIFSPIIEQTISASHSASWKADIFEVNSVGTWHEKPSKIGKYSLKSKCESRQLSTHPFLQHDIVHCLPQVNLETPQHFSKRLLSLSCKRDNERKMTHYDKCEEERPRIEFSFAQDFHVLDFSWLRLMMFRYFRNFCYLHNRIRMIRPVASFVIQLTCNCKSNRTI